MASLHCLLWQEHMGTPIRLHTDARGAQWARALGLPVEIVQDLDAIPAAMGYAWSAGKIHTYAQYNEPFVHADLDVMLGARIPRRVMDAEIFTEKAELYAPPEWFGKFQMPQNWREAWARKDGRTFNMGLFGGSNWQAMQRYAQIAFTFLRDNVGNYGLAENPWQVTATAEQWGFAREVNPMDVTCYMPSGDAFHAAFGHGIYQHLAGPSAKMKFLPGIRKDLLQRDRHQFHRCQQVASMMAQS